MQQIEWPLWGQVQSVSETWMAEVRSGIRGLCAESPYVRVVLAL